MAKESAEQKLLRLIEQGGTPDGSSSDAAPEARQVFNAVQSVGTSVSIPPVVAQVMSWIKEAIKFSPQDGLGVRQINHILMVAVAVMATVVVINVMRGLDTARQSVDFGQPQPVAFSAENLLPQFADIQKYVSAVSFRNIFSPFEKKEVEAPSAVAAATAAVQRVSDRTQTLKLVGVSWLDTPDSASAMVEDTGSGVTYFLRMGEKVNGVRVDAIYADSIVLELDGERLELKL